MPSPAFICGIERFSATAADRREHRISNPPRGQKPTFRHEAVSKHGGVFTKSIKKQYMPARQDADVPIEGPESETSQPLGHIQK